MIVIKLIENYKNLNISETTVQRYLNDEIFSWKEANIRVKMKLYKKLFKKIFLKKNKKEIGVISYLLMNQVFIFIV